MAIELAMIAVMELLMVVVSIGVMTRVKRVTTLTTARHPHLCHDLYCTTGSGCLQNSLV